MNRAYFSQNTTKRKRSHERSELKLHEQNQHASCIRPLRNNFVRMNTYKLFITTIIILITLGSCSDFLTTDLTDKRTDESYYKTPEEAYTALVGCYNGLDLVSSGCIPVVSEVFSDNCFGGTGAGDGYGYQLWDQFDQTLSPSDKSIFETAWKNYYQAIYRCNVLLNRLDQVDWGTQTELKARYEAEAKFLRAYLYFDLVRLFEKIPLLTAPSKENVPQADADSTYQLIFNDLRFAVKNLPSTVYSGTPAGRSTKWAAESMLARAYLFYSGYYGVAEFGGVTKDTALHAVEDVITNSGHDLLTDYTTLWPAASLAKKVTYAGEDNKEVVFAVKFTGNGDYSGNATGNQWLLMMGMREQSIYPYGYGWGACTVDPKLVAQFDKTKDSRFFASVISITDEGLAFTKGSYNREYTGYYIKKYSSLCDSANNPLPNANYFVAQGQDYFAIRYSDVLLMAAELGSPNAVTYYNNVHKRAVPTATPVATVSKEDILAERRLEFAGEGIRYWDLLRQGIDYAATTIANNTTLSVSTGNPSASKIETNIKEKRGFQQIPADEITLSDGVLEQNTGW
jgi:starch-binding outer membrane protein, SusD/RagB family